MIVWKYCSVLIKGCSTTPIRGFSKQHDLNISVLIHVLLSHGCHGYFPTYRSHIILIFRFILLNRVTTGKCFFPHAVVPLFEPLNTLKPTQDHTSESKLTTYYFFYRHIVCSLNLCRKSCSRCCYWCKCSLISGNYRSWTCHVWSQYYQPCQ